MIATGKTRSVTTEWLGLVAAALLTLAACGGPDPAAPGANPAEPAGPPPLSDGCDGITPPRPDGGVWECTWSDEFNSTTLKQAWRQIPYGLGSSCLFNEPEFVQVTAGRLHLIAKPLPRGHWCTEEYGLQYGGGGIQTQGSVAQQYGRFEMRAQFPGGAGFWPAFWLLPDDETFSGEIDIVEVYGGREGSLADATLHVPAAGEGPHTECSVEPDYASGFHTYALEWTPESMRFLYDGEVCAEYTGMTALGVGPPRLSPEFDKPYYVLVNLAVQPYWPPDAATPFPGVMRVDYVRVWR
jgi:Glycosyl hydrolases family 16